MRIKLFTDFSYKLSKRFQNDLKTMMRESIGRLLPEAQKCTLTLRIKDQVKPKDSHNRYFRCSMVLKGLKKQPIVVAKDSERIPIGVNAALNSLAKKLEKEINRDRKNHWKTKRQIKRSSGLIAA